MHTRISNHSRKFNIRYLQQIERVCSKKKIQPTRKIEYSRCSTLSDLNLTREGKKIILWQPNYVPTALCRRSRIWMAVHYLHVSGWWPYMTLSFLRITMYIVIFQHQAEWSRSVKHYIAPFCKYLIQKTQSSQLLHVILFIDGLLHS